MLNNQTNKIGWCDYTWNPISGCLHGCEYCYMLRMEKRFSGIMAPKFHEKRLKDLGSKKLKPGDKIFVGSSGDMWGKWVDRDHINAVLAAIEEHPQYTYLFLTKNPVRYRLENIAGMPTGYFPNNIWAGATVDGTERTKDNIDILSNVTANTFVSFEPLLGPVDPDLTWVDWVIIGADSNRGAEKPPEEWADLIIRKARLADVPIFIKQNYGYPGGHHFREFPEGI